jgi:hypothetical protein
VFLSKLLSLIPFFIISFPPCPLMSSSKELFGYGVHSFVHQDTKCSMPFWCQRSLAFPLLWLVYPTWRQCWTINSRPIIFNTEHVIKSAASLPLPPLLTQLPLTHHTTSDVLEICPLSSYRKTSLHRSCLITVCELQPIASYQYQLPIASCLSSYWSSNHIVSMSVKPSSYFSHDFHTSPCPSICSIFHLFCSAPPTQKDSLLLLLVTWPAYTLYRLHVHCMHSLRDTMNACII